MHISNEDTLLNDRKPRAVNNPNVSDEAKQSAEERLHELEPRDQKDPAHVAAGLKGYVLFSIRR